MKKQTKLVAVLSTASLLAIGASMTSFAATGWVEENGTWVYYDRDEQRVTDQWARSGNGWYYLDENGEMATDRLIEDDGDKYYYVDSNGVMVTNQWVAIENEDAGEDDEPDHYWYYFQANGRAMTNGNRNGVSLKTINGKKYAFDDEGKMLFGWVSEDDAERVDNTDGNGFEDGDYYFGGPDDGAMTVGWLQLDITYDSAVDNHYIAPVFNEDEDQTRWFYFMSNGKKIKADAGDGETQKERTLNGRRYAFDVNGAMIAEWSLDTDDAKLATNYTAIEGEDDGEGEFAATDSNGKVATSARAAHAQYTQQWRYFSDVEDGARITRGWFKVVPTEYLDENKYDDDEENWYYADGSGKLYAGEFKTINGKKFAFYNDGRCVFGLKFIKDNGDSLEVRADDDSTWPFEDEDEFDDHAWQYEKDGFKCYYFGETGDAPTDGAMRTGRQTVSLGGDNFTFYFEKSGGKKGQGVTGEEDDRYYQSGKLLAAGSDEKYQVVKRSGEGTEENPYNYALIDDVDALYDTLKDKTDTDDGVVTYKMVKVNLNAYLDKDDMGDKLSIDNLNQDKEDLDELYVFNATFEDNDVDGQVKDSGELGDMYFLVNTSGRVVDKKGRSKDGSDYYFVTGSNGRLEAIYLED